MSEEQFNAATPIAMSADDLCGQLKLLAQRIRSAAMTATVWHMAESAASREGTLQEGK
jgi:hypothetical protein